MLAVLNCENISRKGLIATQRKARCSIIRGSLLRYGQTDACGRHDVRLVPQQATLRMCCPYAGVVPPGRVSDIQSDICARA
jgi:hypothetical protein